MSQSNTKISQFFVVNSASIKKIKLLWLHKASKTHKNNYGKKGIIKYK